MRRLSFSRSQTLSGNSKSKVLEVCFHWRLCVFLFGLCTREPQPGRDSKDQGEAGPAGAALGLRKQTPTRPNGPRFLRALCPTVRNGIAPRWGLVGLEDVQPRAPLRCTLGYRISPRSGLSPRLRLNAFKTSSVASLSGAGGPRLARRF